MWLPLVPLQPLGYSITLGYTPHPCDGQQECPLTLGQKSPVCYPSLASQPHSIPHHQSLSVSAVSACRGRVRRLRTTFAWTAGTVQIIVGWFPCKARNLLHTSHPPNDSVLAKCSESYCTLCVWVLCYRFMGDKSHVGHWDGTDQSLTLPSSTTAFLCTCTYTLTLLYTLAIYKSREKSA